MFKLIKLIILIFPICFAAQLSGAEYRSVNQAFYHYLALDLSTDILEAYSRDEKAPEKLEKLANRLEDLAEYATDSEVAYDFLAINKVLNSLGIIVSGFARPQQIPDPDSVHVAVSDIRDYLKQYMPALVDGGITRPANIPVGAWKLTDTVSDGPYAGMKIGFKLRLWKGDITFEAEGEKYWENGRELPEHQRSPIRIYGVIINNVVRAAYKEKGLENGSTGEFVWLVQDDGTLSGLFVSSTGAKGESRLTRECRPNCATDFYR